MNAPTDRATRFTAVYDAAYLDLLRYVQRRTPAGAEDVVAETMTTAWRRIDELPTTLDDARAWLFGIARNQLLNAGRSVRRQDALAIRLGSNPAGHAPDAAEHAIPRADLARAWAALDSDDQEVIALTVLDGLTSEHAGRVLDISAAAYRHRLSRARGRLRHHLDGEATTLRLLPQETR